MSDQFETNVFGPARLTREIIPHMRRKAGDESFMWEVYRAEWRLPVLGSIAPRKRDRIIGGSIRFELRPSGIEAAVVEPGHIRTSFKENRRQAKIYERGASAHQNALDGVLRFGNRPKGPGPHVVAVKILSVLQSPKLQNTLSRRMGCLLGSLCELVCS